MSLPQNMSLNTLNTIVNKFNLKEVLGTDGDIFMKLREKKSIFSPRGPIEVDVIVDIRIFNGGPLQDLVYAGIVVPGMVDSHMIFAFMPKESAVPHFTLDSIGSFIPTQILAYHLDLVPRVDMGANLQYLYDAYQPLTEAYENTSKLEGLTKAHISPLQYSLMSPWMLTHRATEEAFKQLPEVVNSYLEHWFGLVENGVETSYSAHELSQRDNANRAAIFNIEVDPVWNRIIPLLGQDNADILLQILRTGYHNKGSELSSAEVSI